MVVIYEWQSQQTIYDCIHVLKKIATVELTWYNRSGWEFSYKVVNDDKCTFKLVFLTGARGDEAIPPKAYIKGAMIKSKNGCTITARHYYKLRDIIMTLIIGAFECIFLYPCIIVLREDIFEGSILGILLTLFIASFIPGLFLFNYCFFKRQKDPLALISFAAKTSYKQVQQS